MARVIRAYSLPVEVVAAVENCAALLLKNPQAARHYGLINPATDAPPPPPAPVDDSGMNEQNLEYLMELVGHQPHKVDTISAWAGNFKPQPFTLSVAVDRAMRKSKALADEVLAYGKQASKQNRLAHRKYATYNANKALRIRPGPERYINASRVLEVLVGIATPLMAKTLADMGAEQGVAKEQEQTTRVGDGSAGTRRNGTQTINQSANARPRQKATINAANRRAG